MAAKKAVAIYNLAILTMHSIFMAHFRELPEDQGGILVSYLGVFCQAIGFSKRNELGKKKSSEPQHNV